MYIKLIILLAFAGLLSAQNTTTNETTTITTQETTTSAAAATTEAATTTTTQATTTSAAAATTEAATTTTTQATTTSTAAATTEAETTTTAQATTTSTAAATTEATTTTARPRRPGPLGPHRPPGPHRPHRPHGPPPHKHLEIPGLPILSGILDTFRDAAEALFPGPRGGLGGPRGPGGFGPSRRPRAISNPLNGSSSSGQNSLSLSSGFSLSSFQIPNPEDMVPEIPDLSGISNIQIPEIPSLQSLPPIPGLQGAMDQARGMVANDINAKGDLVSGIHEAMVNGLNSSNPTDAFRSLISTILKAYLAVARHCPFLIVGGYVLHEGLSLSASVLTALADITGQIQNDI